MGTMAGRKSSDDVRGEKAAAKVKREAHFAKIAAYDAKYKADALARREKGPDAAPAAAPEAK